MSETFAKNLRRIPAPTISRMHRIIVPPIEEKEVTETSVVPFPLETCEFLMILKEDYINVLKSAMEAEWRIIRTAMRTMPFFAKWSEEDIDDCIEQCTYKLFDSEEAILEANSDRYKNVACFIISGQCRLIREIAVRHIKQPSGNTRYCLMPLDQYKEEVRLRKLAASRSLKVTNVSLSGLESTIIEEEEEEKLIKIKEEEQLGEGEEEEKDIDDEVNFPSELSLSTRSSTEEAEAEIEEEFKNISYQYELEEESIRSLPPPRPLFCQFGSKEPRDYKPKTMREPKSPYTKNHFLQICVLESGHTFSLGEDLTNIWIVSARPTGVMMMPRFYLQTGTRVEDTKVLIEYLESRYPKEKEVFEKYVEENNWRSFKQDLVQTLVGHRKMTLETKYNDAPFCLRVGDVSTILS